MREDGRELGALERGAGARADGLRRVREVSQQARVTLALEPHLHRNTRRVRLVRGEGRGVST